MIAGLEDMSDGVISIGNRVVDGWSITSCPREESSGSAGPVRDASMLGA